MTAGMTSDSEVFRVFKQPRPGRSFLSGQRLRLDVGYARYCRAVFPHVGMKDAKKRQEAPHAPATVETAASEDLKRKPIQTFREGDVSVSIWAREHMAQGQPRTFFTCTFERSYRDRDGAWRYARSFDRDSLGKLVAVVQRADEYLRGLMEPQDTRGA